jgi:hypothetical protein
VALPAGEADHQIALVEFRMTRILDRLTAPPVITSPICTGAA